jgi:hypothetical protein
MSSPSKYQREVTMTDQEYEQRKQCIRKRKRTGKIFNPGALDDETYEDSDKKNSVKMAGNRIGYGKTIESMQRARVLYDHKMACRTRHIESTDSDEEYHIHHSKRNALTESKRFTQEFEAPYGKSSQQLRRLTNSLSDFPSVGFTSMNQRLNLHKESYVPYSTIMGSKQSHHLGFIDSMFPGSHALDPLHRHYSNNTVPRKYNQDGYMMNRDRRSHISHEMNTQGNISRHLFHQYNPYQPSSRECSNEGADYEFSDTEDGNDNEEYFVDEKRSQFDSNEVKVLPPENLRWEREDDTLGAGNSWIQRRRQAKEGANATFTKREDLKNSFFFSEEEQHLQPAKNTNEMRRPKSRVPENITIVSNNSSVDHETTKVRAMVFAQSETKPLDIARKLKQHSVKGFQTENISAMNSWPTFYFGSETPGSNVIDFHLLVVTEQTFQHSSLLTSIMMDDHVYTPQQIKNQEELRNARCGDLEAIARGFVSMLQNCDHRSFVSVEFLDYDKLENAGPFLLVIGVLDIDDEDVKKKISIGGIVTIVRGTLKGSKGIVKDIADSKVLLVMTENHESVTRWIPQKNVEVMDDLKILQHIESSASTVETAHCKPQVGTIHNSCQQQQVEKNYHHGSAAYSPNTGENSNSYILSGDFYGLDDECKMGTPSSLFNFEATFASIWKDEGVCFPDEKDTNEALETQIQDQTTIMERTSNYQVVTNPAAASTLEINGFHDSESMKTANNESDCIVSVNQTESEGDREKRYNEGKHEFLVDKSGEYNIHTREATQFPDATECNMLPVNVCKEEDSSKSGRELPPSKRKPVAAIALTKRRFGDLQDEVDLRSQSILTMSEFDMPPKTLFKVFVNIKQHSDKSDCSNPFRDKPDLIEAQEDATLSTYNKPVGEKQFDDSRSAWKFIESMSVLELKDKLKCMKLPANGSKQQLFEKLVTALMVNKNTPIEELPDMITKFNP